MKIKIFYKNKEQDVTKIKNVTINITHNGFLNVNTLNCILWVKNVCNIISQQCTTVKQKSR